MRRSRLLNITPGVPKPPLAKSEAYLEAERRFLIDHLDNINNFKAIYEHNKVSNTASTIHTEKLT